MARRGVAHCIRSDTTQHTTRLCRLVLTMAEFNNYAASTSSLATTRCIITIKLGAMCIAELAPLGLTAVTRCR